ncbi:MAG: hypothetical protein L6V90_07240 [Treponema succinifaciens]|nr:MAG: hypothetical protein L6V90_07240 [Treponema succinifaciens]
MCFSLDSEKFSRPLNVSLLMLGEFQARNAAVASLAVKTVFPNLDESIIEKGLEKTVLPGRFEPVDLSTSRFENISNLILDGAHTVKSIGFTMDTFCNLFSNAKTDSYLLFACASDKKAEEIAELFKGKFSHIILTVPGGTKESDFPRLKAAFEKSGIEYTAIPDYLKAIPYILSKAAEEKATVLVTGSFYLVAEVKKYLLAQKTIIQFSH